MNYNELAREIHENAVKHGWYDKPISQYEYAALFHSEISEAFEEYRDGMPDVYWNCGVTGEICNPASEYDCEYYGAEWECTHRHQEPHGIAIELIDLAIRVLDYAGAKEWDIDATETMVDEIKEDFVLLINAQHAMVCMLIDGAYELDIVRALLDSISCYCESKHLDFESLLRLKHEYNKTRPYRHGGKRC